MNSVPLPRILCSVSQLRAEEEAYHVRLSMAEITMSVLQLAPMMVKRVPRHGKYTAFCAEGCRHRGGHCLDEAHHSVS